ncbi:MAG: cob(I)yrinic acid a,c-diamide adenosyltransferase [Subdoligranulum sp.]|nr:cob(I)yrinic acid a,c-diamide adenosyltransferase [Subdoligranulum sp.]
MLHLYWGNGKGKTTAAMGLALRALGHGRRVVIVQFLKDGTSGEIAPLRAAGAAVYACPNAKFTWLMDEADKAAAREASARALGQALAEPFDLLVLDEACAALKSGILDEALLRRAVAFAKNGREVVLTGRDPAPWLQDAADYSTEMRAHRHPYADGVAAREGVEY